MVHSVIITGESQPVFNELNNSLKRCGFPAINMNDNRPLFFVKDFSPLGKKELLELDFLPKYCSFDGIN